MCDFDALHSGKLYDAMDPAILEEQKRCVALVNEYNATTPFEGEKRQELLTKIFRKVGKNCYVEPPLHCNFGGKFISLGDNVYINFEFIGVDDTYIEIGNNVLIGPRVTIAVATHPEDPAVRATGAQFNRKVVIEDNVWIGAGAIILPGVTIHENTIIGAGSVVTHDIEAGVVAVGNPCRVLRKVRTQDRA